MPAPRLLSVNVDELVDAMTVFTGPEDVRSYLDTRDGAIVFPFDSEEDFEPESWHEPIPHVEGHDEYDVMARFADAETDPDVVELLRFALDGKGAFRRFRDVIARDRELQQRWYAFKADADRARVIEWLASLDIEPVDTSPPRPDRSAAAPAPVTTPAPTISLVDLLVLGGPDGKTELLEGRVPRVFIARSPDEARVTFRALAREIAYLCDVPWRKALVADGRFLRLGRFELRLDGSTIELDVETTIETWRKFG